MRNDFVDRSRQFSSFIDSQQIINSGDANHGSPALTGTQQQLVTSKGSNQSSEHLLDGYNKPLIQGTTPPLPSEEGHP